MTPNPKREQPRTRRAPRRDDVRRAMKRMEDLRKFCIANARDMERSVQIREGYFGCKLGVAKCIEILKEECRL